MGGVLPGPWSNWAFIGTTNLLASGSAVVEGKFPAGIQAGDLVVAVMSPLGETIKTTMTTAGWQHWAQGNQDYVCTAKYAPGLAAPKWARERSNSLFVSVLVFRAPGWSSLKLESHTSPAVAVDVTSKLQNELLLCIGITPKTTSGWAVHMTGASPIARVERALAPAMQIYSANIDYPHKVSGISVDALSGLERNLILSAS